MKKKIFKIATIFMAVAMIASVAFTGMGSVSAQGTTSYYAGIYTYDAGNWDAHYTSERFDLTKGFYFKINGGLQKLMFQLTEKSDPADLGIQTALYFQSSNNDLLSWRDSNTSDTYGSVDDVHFLQAVYYEAIWAWLIYIDGKPLPGAGISTAAFDAINNYSQEEGKYLGCHFVIVPQNFNARVKVLPKTEAAFAANEGTVSYTCSNNYLYNTHIPAWTGATSLWQVDLTDGLSFNASSLLNASQWLRLDFADSFLSDATIGVVLRNCDGKLEVRVMKHAAWGGERHRTVTNLDISDTHILSFKLNAETSNYDLYIDDVVIDGSAETDSSLGGVFSLTADEFKAINNGNEDNSQFEGSTFIINSNDTLSLNNVAVNSLLKNNLGNLNNDTQIDTTDLILMCKYLLGVDIQEEFYDVLADINWDNNINVLDFIRIKKLLP